MRPLRENGRLCRMRPWNFWHKTVKWERWKNKFSFTFCFTVVAKASYVELLRFGHIQYTYMMNSLTVGCEKWKKWENHSHDIWLKNHLNFSLLDFGECLESTIVSWALSSSTILNETSKFSLWLKETFSLWLYFWSFTVFFHFVGLHWKFIRFGCSKLIRNAFTLRRSLWEL